MSSRASQSTRHSDLSFLTAADARRMEAAEEYGAVRYAEAIRQLHPDLGSAWEEICGGHMVFVARGSPVGRAHGLGFAGEIAPQDIEKVEKFYFDHECDAQVDVCPYADPSLFQALNLRGFQVAEFNQTLARWIRREETFGAATFEKFRGRGIQSAFMQERLRLAQQAGCDLAVTLTMPGTTSQRNVERAGFRVAYTKVVVSKRHPAGSGGPAQVHYSA